MAKLQPLLPTKCLDCQLAIARLEASCLCKHQGQDNQEKLSWAQHRIEASPNGQTRQTTALATREGRIPS